MNIFKSYIEYIKDNPEGYWFKRKLYGWGWTPVKWQGWAILLITIYFIISAVIDFKTIPIPTDKDGVEFIVKVVLYVIVMLIFCHRKGEKPGWQWGIKK